MEEFVRRNLGDEVFERLIEPFCSGRVIDKTSCEPFIHLDVSESDYLAVFIFVLVHP